MLAASAAERACFALIPIGIVSMSIGIRVKSIGIGAFPIGIKAKSIGIGAIPIGIGLIPTGIGLIPAGIVSIPIGIRAIPIDFAPVPIGIGAMQTRFQLPLRAFSRSKAVPQRMTQRSAWLQFLQKFKTEKSSRSSDNPSCCRSQLGLIFMQLRNSYIYRSMFLKSTTDKFFGGRRCDAGRREAGSGQSAQAKRCLPAAMILNRLAAQRVHIDAA